MENRVRVLGHPVHQALVVLPMGLLGMAVVFDLLHLASGAPELARASCWLLAAGIAGGLLGALAAAPFGLIDWLQIRRAARARLIGLLHGGGNLAVLALFGSSLWLRMPEHEASALAQVLSFVALGLALTTGWLGGELALRYGIGVQEHPGIAAPGSPGGRPATTSFGAATRAH